MTQLFVIKRDGSRVPFQLEKWQAQIAKVCDGVDGVSPSQIEISSNTHFYDGMTTRELDNIALRAMCDLIDEEEHPDIGNVNYQHVAGKQRIAMLRKDVYGSYDPPHILEIVKKNIAAGFYTAELLEWYTEDEWNKINDIIDHEKDESLPYAAVEQLIEKYLVQDRTKKGVVLESPQVRYIIAAATAFHAETSNRLKYVKEFYNAASDGLFTLATPVLAGLGTPTKQFSSCVLIKVGDSLKSIFASGEVMANYAAKRAGIGLDIGRMRALGAPIRGGEVKHTGVIPFLKKFYADLRSCSQGGIRNASCTVYLPIWHLQFDDFVVLRNNQGTDETRIRQLDYSVVMSALFWRRFKEGGDITFFDPNEVPDLYDAYYRDTAEFNKLYVKYEKRTDIRKKVQPAEVVIKDWILKERGDTGRIYIMNVDNVNQNGAFDSQKWPVYQSNLCCEITLPSLEFQRIEDDSGLIGLCTLGSINWGAFRNPEEIKRPAIVLQRMLHNLLQYQDFLSVQSARHNALFEPLGIGITNLAYWHAKRKLRYGEKDALAEVKRWMEHLNYYLMEGTVNLAKEKGKCQASDDTWYGKGQFIWERRAKGADDLTDFTPDSDLDWEGLREKMKEHGVRNAVNLAIAPVESSSVVINSTNGINLVKQLITIKESKAGAFAQVVPEYRRLKKNYQLLWDQPDCIGYIKTAAVLQVYIDQSISTDTFYNPAKFKDGKIPATLLAKNLMLAHRWGVKTFYYDLRSKESLKEMINVDDILRPLPPDRVDPNTLATLTVDDDCEACKL